MCQPFRARAVFPDMECRQPEASLPYIAIGSVFFNTRAEAEKFSGLFGFEEAARLLSADFPNYTPGPRDVIMAEVTKLTDVDGLIGRHQPKP